VASTDKSMPAAPADSGGCGCFSVVAPQVNVMLDLHIAAVVFQLWLELRATYTQRMQLERQFTCDPMFSNSPVPATLTKLAVIKNTL